jgi:membrane-associated phospholipid phosphatase
MHLLRNTHILLLSFGFILLISFYQCSRMARDGFLKDADFAVSIKIQERIDGSSRLRLASIVGDVMEGSTFLASPELSIVFVGFLTLIALIDIKQKKIRLRALLIPILFALLVMGEIYGKSVVHHPAPPFFMIKNPTTIFPKHYINEQFSYPSGHVARAVFLGITCYSLFFIHNSLFKRRTHVLVAVGIICYILIVSISRIYLGHHWLSDVIGGILLGSSLGVINISALFITRRD